MGHLLGDDVECAYHGMKFDRAGKCIANPNGPGIIPQAAAVRAYTVCERFNVVWIWMGDPKLADPASIPDLRWLTDPTRFTQTHGTTKLPASYLLVVDNLMDLRHVVFLHQALEPREHALLPVKDSEEDGRVWARISSPASDPPPFFAMSKNLAGQKVDHWQDMLCYPPGAMVIFYGVTQPGQPRELGFETFNISLVTPETAKSSHYLWASARNFDLDNAALTEGMTQASKHAFAFEDSPVLEAQQRAIGDRDLLDCSPVLFSNDVPAGRVRRLIERRLTAERAASVPQRADATAPM
jgi:vanillate O-demethylase monooxygenase subunit